MSPIEKANRDHHFQFFLARCMGRPMKFEEEGWIVKGFVFRGVAYITDMRPVDPDDPAPNPFRIEP